MARKVVPFGEDPVDELVTGFLRRKGIDPKDVTGYRISRGVDQVGILTVDFLYEPEDEKPWEPPGGFVDDFPRVSTVNPNTTGSDGNPHHNHR